jgi:hypothetical protein
MPDGLRDKTVSKFLHVHCQYLDSPESRAINDHGEGCLNVCSFRLRSQAELFFSTT